MFQYPGHHGAATADSEADKWRRVSPDQSPGPGMIDSGRTGDQQAAERWSHDLYSNNHNPPPGHLVLNFWTLFAIALGLSNIFFLGATEWCLLVTPWLIGAQLPAATNTIYSFHNFQCDCSTIFHCKWARTGHLAPRHLSPGREKVGEER